MVDKRAGLVVAVSLMLTCSAPGARASWPEDPINGNVVLCNAAGIQQAAAVCSDGAGGAIVAWQDLRSGGLDIYAQRVSATGVPLWTANGVALCTAAGTQILPVILSDGVGGAIVAWQDARGGANTDVYAQRVDAAGTPLWTANGVALSTAAGNQDAPSIATDGQGGAVIAWMDTRSGTTDIYARRINAAGAPQWTADGVALCTAAGAQDLPKIASDGAGGGIVTWHDARAGALDVYAQRVNGSGVAAWTVNGVALCTASNNQRDPVIASDAAGGAIVAWRDNRNAINHYMFIQRVNSAGTSLWTANGVGPLGSGNLHTAPAMIADGSGGAILAYHDVSTFDNIYAQRVNALGVTQWPSNLAVCAENGVQQSVQLVSDGAGGAIFTWQDDRNGSTDVYAQRLNATGTAQWTSGGVAVSIASGIQSAPALAHDGASGAILAWSDQRGADSDIYAQRVERSGRLGNMEPVIADVGDVPNDQGGRVRVSWYASPLDRSSDPSLVAYDIYRSVPGSLAPGAARLAGFGEAATAAAAGRDAFVVEPDGAALYAWEYLASVNAVHFIDVYGYVANTTGDSIGGSNPLTAFMVVARNTSGSIYWLSAPDSGYSVDNLAPVAPTPFTASYALGSTYLHWQPNDEADLAGYRLYRGADPGFVPGPDNRIAAQPDTGYADPGPAGSWYKLAAVDVHGNEGPYALIGPASTIDVGPGPLPGRLALASPWPSPARGDATVAFTLPAAADVQLALYSIDGHRVRVLASGPYPAGRHVVGAIARDARGRSLESGVYFVRLATAGRTLSRRFVVAR